MFRELLKDLAQGSRALEATYTKMWHIINEHGAEEVHIAQDVFALVSYSARLLTGTELQYAVAAQAPFSASIDPEDLYDEAVLTEPCLGLITINDTHLVDFVHATAREFFYDHLSGLFAKTQEALCKACWSYLVQEGLGRCTEVDEIQSHFQNYPFLSYAAQFWSLHARQAGDHFQYHDLAELLSSHVNTVERVIRLTLCFRHNCLRQILEEDNTPSWSFSETLWTRFPTKIAPQHLAAFASLHALAASLLDRGADPNATDSNGWTALRWAALTDSVQVMELLVDHGASVDSKDAKNSQLFFGRSESVIQVLVYCQNLLN